MFIGIAVIQFWQYMRIGTGITCPVEQVVLCDEQMVREALESRVNGKYLLTALH